MKAHEARKLTHDHSKRMQEIFKKITDCAKSGGNYVELLTSECTKEEMSVLRDNGFDAGYEISKTDGGQFIFVKW